MGQSIFRACRLAMIMFLLLLVIILLPLVEDDPLEDIPENNLTSLVPSLGLGLEVYKPPSLPSSSPPFLLLDSNPLIHPFVSIPPYSLCYPHPSFSLIPFFPHLFSLISVQFFPVTFCVFIPFLFNNPLFQLHPLSIPWEE